jgi:hypothetical protein
MLFIYNQQTDKKFMCRFFFYVLKFSRFIAQPFYFPGRRNAEVLNRTQLIVMSSIRMGSKTKHITYKP